MEYDISAVNDEFHRLQMEKFAIQAEETIEAQRNLCIQQAEEELRRKEDARLEDQLQNQYLESSSHNSAYEAIENERQRLQYQESFLSQETLRLDVRWSILKKSGKRSPSTS